MKDGGFQLEMIDSLGVIHFGCSGVGVVVVCSQRLVALR